MLAVRDRLIVALDVATAAEARHIISALGDSVSTFKVGKQLFTAEGPTLVREGVAGRAVDQVLRLASLARSAGCNGVVSAVSEAAALRRELGEGFAIVTPGVRPAGAAKDDQARVATPRQALAAGASHIVVGRPITAAADPAAAARAILEEMSAAESIGKV